MRGIAAKKTRLTKVDIIFIVLIFIAVGAAVVTKFVNGPEPPKLPPLLITDQASSLLTPVQGDYVLNTTLPEVPARVMVYRIMPYKVDEKYVNDLLAKFEVNPVRRTRQGYFTTVVDHQKNVVGITTSSFSYISSSSENNKGVGLPNDNDAKEIAISYLKSKGFFPNDKFTITTNVANLMGWYDPSAGMETKPVTSKNIILNRQIGSLRDSYSFISVEVGDHQRITGVKTVWPKLEPYMKYPILSPQEAFKKLQAGEIAADSNLEGEIKKVYLTYLTDHDMGDPASNYLLPVYIFEGNEDAAIVFAVRDDYVETKGEIGDKPTRDRVKTIKQFDMPVPERIVQLSNGRLVKNITREKPEFNRLVDSIKNLLVYTQVNEAGRVTDIARDSEAGSKAWLEARKILEEGDAYRVKFMDKSKISTSFAPLPQADKDQYGNFVINAEQLFLVQSKPDTINLLYDNGKKFFIKTIKDSSLIEEWSE